MPRSGRKYPDRQLWQRLDAVCSRIGADAAGARLIKFTNNAVFELPAAGLVIRIAGSAAMHYRVQKVVDVARWLEREGFPAVRLQPGIDQPVTAAGDLATVWVREIAAGPLPTITELGQLLRRFHQLPHPATDLPEFDPIADIRVRLDHADHPAVDREDLDFLAERCDALERRLRRASFQLPRGPIHGDAHTGNIIRTAAGPVLADFDSTTSGPREWDLVPVWFGVHRLGDPPGNVDRLSDAYGVDITDLPGMDVLLGIRELKLVTSVIPVLKVNPDVAAQFRVRMSSIKRGDAAVWQRYS